MLSLLAQSSTTTTDFGTSAADTAAEAAVGTAALGIGVGMMVFWFIAGTLSLVLFIWALIDVIKREFPNQNDKILWIVLILVLGGLGPLLYLLIGRKKGTMPATPKQA